MNLSSKINNKSDNISNSKGNNRSVIVLKFGGAATSTPQSFLNIADIIIDRANKYNNIVVVVSAMGNTTDELIALAHQVNSHPPKRELDMLLTVGERISISLLAMALAKKNKDAVSFTGSQSGIITSDDHNVATIVEVRPRRILSSLEQGKIVIVAGFQGMSLQGEITTLGRGGSDITAVALASALGAQKVEFFKDVLGIYDKDPKKFPNEARLFKQLSYEQAYQLTSSGAKVLHANCVSLAQKHNVHLHILPFEFYQDSEKNQGTLIK